ncbi:MAG: WD40 repeat domain-containing protein, partial [Actinobacteria bacterium]|nr:WD40 repeat domain-containing protein [Actinomycetota bacterium]NIS29412.1 WD40 repeat domain-containing protein [Actinomycetota bacterium]NIT96665.1 WD40 repeat domain-containing protein [Actinomycetota bacterium]NIU20362.1 WD40 repeat domain-containing protein [Actinomycetota bacterium]NIU68056.1 WD40 repeat domain-containing protein [Actinomycetota bacterium]
MAAIVSAGLGIFAIGQSRDAQQQARLSRSRELAVAALDQIDEDPELAVLLAVEAVRAPADAGEDVPAEAIDSLHRSLASLRIVFRADGSAVAISGDGAVAARLTDDAITLTDRNGVVARTVAGPEGSASIALNASGSVIAVGTVGGGVAFIDAATGLPADVPGELGAAAHDDRIGRLAFAAGDTLLVTSSDDSRMRLWDVATGDRIVSEAHSGDSVGVGVSADGEVVVYGTEFSGVTRQELNDG